MKIGHISDAHIRFSSRYEEYKEVFQRLYDDLKKQKPNYIVFTGDLFHQKVSLSPTSINLAAEFIANLSMVAPVFFILGNHDINLSQKNQGDAITAMIDVANKFYEISNSTSKKDNRRAFIVSDENKGEIDFSKKGVYFFPDSGFYKVSEKLVLGVYSCKDGKILTLDKKEPGTKYVALYHGMVKGGKMNNGYELFGDDMLNISAFNNFDVVMMGDLHEHQSFREDESMAYTGSLVQQDYGESINKSYLLWDLNTNTFQRRFILNDYGFAKITIAKGESVEERVENIQFSNDKKKTKVYLVWEDHEENYSTEKETQIIKLVKQKHGCETVKVEFSEIKKAKQDNKDVQDSRNKETFLQQIADYLKEINPDEEKETIEEVLMLADFIDKELEISEKIEDIKLWDIDCIEISNIFSFPEKPIIINLENLRGSVGIFGKGYTGKSNIIKSIVWGLYGHILGGEMGSAKKLVNIYTPSNKGYVKINLTIEGEKYYIKREVITKVDKRGDSSNSYPIEYKKLVTEDGEQKWVSEISEKGANDKREIKNIFLSAIGTVDDFTKVCLQPQGGKEDYINQEQQPKNDLVNKYLGLESFRDRYEYGNKIFNDVKKKQKELGDIATLQIKVVELEDTINNIQKEYDLLLNEKTNCEAQKDIVDNRISELSKTLKQYNQLLRGELNNEPDILNNIDFLQNKIKEDEVAYKNLFEWVSSNFKKELPFDENETVESLNKELSKESAEFTKDKNRYVELDNWIKLNPQRQPTNIDGFDNIIKNLNTEITNLNAKLPTYLGQKCPTCGHITLQPNQELYNQCLNDIKTQTEILNSYINAVNKFNEDTNHNKNCEIKNSNLLALKATLTTRKAKKDSLAQKITLISQSQDVLKHNQLVEHNNLLLLTTKKNIDDNNRFIENLNSNLSKIRQNDENKKHNASIEEEISQLQEQSKAHKISIYGLSQQIITKNGDLRVEKNNFENYKGKLEDVKNAEKIYKKYSLYLQAVHRDGLPAKIIRRKLPLINNKINSILSSIVNFKVEMSVTVKGDIIEGFYFRNDKSDMLPLSFASGSQKFISSIAIKDALHYMSNLIKPSLNIIDEGFGSLDDDLIVGIITVLQYLKNKYKNVIITTHRNEIKDSVDNIIEVYKTFDNITQEDLEANENAGITNINIS